MRKTPVLGLRSTPRPVTVDRHSPVFVDVRACLSTFVCCVFLATTLTLTHYPASPEHSRVHHHHQTASDCRPLPTMSDSIEFLIQQVKGLPSTVALVCIEANTPVDNCQWYFGHSVQVITTYDPDNSTWRAIVYPSECTLASAGSYEIHLHASASRYLHSAVKCLLQNTHRQIAECFRFGSEGEVPVVKEREAPCNCLPWTLSRMMAKQGSEARDVQTALGRVGRPSPDKADQHSISGAPDETTGSCGLSPPTSEGQDIWPVLQKIESTLQVTEQRTHDSCPVETLTPGGGMSVVLGANQLSARVQSLEQVITPIGDLQLVAQPAGPSDVSEVSQFETEHTGLNCFLGRHSSAAPHRVKSLSHGTAETQSAPAAGKSGTARADPGEGDENTRDIVREEIGRALAGAMDSLAGIMWRGDNGGT